MTPIRLGILQTNHDKSVAAGDAFPDDAHRFRDLFDAQQDRFRYRIYMTIGGEVPTDIDAQDAFLITGSPLSVLDKHLFSDDLAAFIRKCDAAKKPLLGACFGHQAIAQALGGQVEKSPTGYNVGIEKVTFDQKRAWMMPPHDSLDLFVYHEDQVTQLPAGCDLLGSGETCQIASFAKGNHIFTTQAHPEFTPEFMDCLLRASGDYLPEETRKTAQASLLSPQHGAIFAAWVTHFFKGALQDA